MIATKGYAAQSATTPLAPFSYEHREPGPNDILLDIDFCGICHSDIHQARNEWGNSLYPMVPGHEIVGTVTAVGDEVTKFKVGDTAAVGCMVDSCRECASCTGRRRAVLRPSADRLHLQQQRQGRQPDLRRLRQPHRRSTRPTSLSVPKNLDQAAAAPLLCAGITTYAPLKHWKIGPGSKVGIIGLGGLGHMGLKFSHAFGAHTVQFTTSAGKIEDAKKLGADEVILTKEANWHAPHANSFDFILDTVSGDHDLAPYLALLKRNGTLCTVGLPEKPFAVSGFSVIARRNFTGSMIGGIAETQEMLDFCGEHNIVSDIEMTTFDKLDTAWDRVLASDVKYRFVLDCKGL